MFNRFRRSHTLKFSPAVSDNMWTSSFDTFLAQWADDVNSLTAAVESWSQNKVDVNPNFNFASAQTALVSARASLETAVSSVTST